jgi:hypothetical protein
MKNKICVTLGQDHIWRCADRVISRSGEHKVTEIEITLDECLFEFWVYLKFTLPNGETFLTEKLDRVGNVVTYDIVNALVSESGILKVQAMLKKETGESWESTIKPYIVEESIEAVNDIPEKEDFIVEAQKVLNDIENGLTPTIGENGNWYVGDRDTGKTSIGGKADEGKAFKITKTGTSGYTDDKRKNVGYFTIQGTTSSISALERVYKLEQTMYVSIKMAMALSFLEVYSLKNNGDGTAKIEVYGYKTVAFDNSSLLGQNLPENYLTVVRHPELGDILVNEYAFQEGEDTVAQDRASHTEGAFTNSVGRYGHAEGTATVAGYNAHAEGSQTIASGDYSHSEGIYTKATREYSHAEGNSTTASGINSHSEGRNTKSSGDHSHSEGYATTSSGNASHSEGAHCVASGYYSHAEGWNTVSSGQYSHSEGKDTTASEESAHSEGFNTVASGKYSHSQGEKTLASGTHSHAEGWNTQATNKHAHSQGYDTKASGDSSHSEGRGSEAGGIASHAEGSSKALGGYSHAENFGNLTESDHTHIEGISNVIPKGATAQHVQGKYNLSDWSKAHIVGGGTSNTNRKNIHTIDWSGNGWFAGGLIINNDENVATEKQIQQLEARIKELEEIINSLKN